MWGWLRPFKKKEQELARHLRLRYNSESEFEKARTHLAEEQAEFRGKLAELEIEMERHGEEVRRIWASALPDRTED